MKRIIPAYAGSTVGLFRQVAREPGSSPHTRGALPVTCSGNTKLRIIPAYAGSTGVFLSLFVPMSDHPRIRGEHVRVRNDSLLFVGSSPHTRGAPTSTIW